MQSSVDSVIPNPVTMSTPLLVMSTPSPLALASRSTSPAPPSPSPLRKQITLPNVAANAANLSLSPPPPSSPVSKSAPGSKSPRRKALGPGCGLLDWIRLCRSGKDLTSTGGKTLRVTQEELEKHNTIDDAWTAIRGTYMQFCAFGTPTPTYMLNSHSKCVCIHTPKDCVL